MGKRLGTAVAVLLLGCLGAGCSAADPRADAATDAASGPTGAAGPTDPLPTSTSPATPAGSAQRVGGVTPEVPVSITLPETGPVPVLAVSTTANGLLDVPDDLRQAGWWRGGSQVGDPFGSTLVAAHVDSRTEGLGPFASLLGARPGERVVLRGETLEQTFEIRSLRLRPRDAIGAGSPLHSPDGPRRLTLVTCAGPFVPALGGYQRLAVVTAVPVAAPVSRPPVMAASRAPDPPVQRTPRRIPVAPVVLTLLMLLLLTAYVGLDLVRGGGGTGPQTAPSRVEVPPAPDGAPEVGSYVESRVEADGQVSVRQWIRSEVPIQRLELTTADPDALPGTVEAARVLLSATDGSRLAFRASVGTQTQRVRLREPATEVYLTYTIGGDTVSRETATVAGRVLARVTGMDVVFEGESGPTVRVVRGAGPVLNAACLPNDAGFDAVPVPCGAAGTDGAWQVDLPGGRRHERLIAQLDSGAAS